MMNGTHTLLMALCLTLGLALPVPRALADTMDLPAGSEDVAPSVVHIAGFMGNKDQRAFVEASGLIVEENGLVLSVASVFTDLASRRLCERFEVRLSDGRKYAARMYSADPILNLIVLRPAQAGQYPPVALDVPPPVRPGDRVLALAGSAPRDLQPPTVGYVKTRHKKSIYGAGLGDMFIDSKMRLPAPAYGGPLLNDRAEVIGINTPNVHHPNPQQADPEEAHALPTIVLKGFLRIASVMPTSKQNWLGLAFRPLNATEREKTGASIGQRTGIAVDFVWPDGPAGASGIAPGDVLFELNGTRMRTLHDLDRLLAKAAVDSTARLALVREGQVLLKDVSVQPRPPWAGLVPWTRARNAARSTLSPDSDNGS